MDEQAAKGFRNYATTLFVFAPYEGFYKIKNAYGNYYSHLIAYHYSNFSGGEHAQ
jgi:hypothetical protein